MRLAPSSDMALFEPVVSDPRWTQRLPHIDDLVATVLARANRAETRGSVVILFTNDAEMRSLNSRWRGLDKATDVLSFPSSGPGEPGGPQPLGDIAVGYETAMRDAKDMGRPVERMSAILLVHGFLHLLGHDHVAPADAVAMESLETAILADLGWPDPYRTGPYLFDSSGKTD